MPIERYFARTTRLTGKDLEVYTRLRGRLNGLGNELAKRIAEHAKDNALFVVLDRDARPIYLALRKLGLDAKLLPITRDMMPEKLLSEIEARRVKEVFGVEDIIAENQFFEGDSSTKAIDRLLKRAGILGKNKERKVVIIDSGYIGTIPIFLKTRLLLNGHKADALVWHNLVPEHKRGVFTELEARVDEAYGRINSFRGDPFYEPSEKNENRKESDLFLLALAEELIDKLKPRLERLNSHM